MIVLRINLYTALGKSCERTVMQLTFKLIYQSNTKNKLPRF